MSARDRPARCPGRPPTARGGTDATTTDANLALGRINRDYFCGGEIVADMRGRRRGARRGSASGLAVAPIEVARGIVRIANNNMINALKLVSLNRGYDPRDFALVAFGGGGGMHAAALGRRARLPQGGDPARLLGVLRLGHDDVRPAARLFRRPA